MQKSTTANSGPDSLFMATKANLLIPSDPQNMVLENSLYIPENLSANYHSHGIRDLGLGKGAGHSLVFEEKRPTGEAFSHLTKYNPVLLINFLSRLSNYLAWNGMKSCKEDKRQNDLLQKGITEGEKRGLKKSLKFQQTDNSLYMMVGPELINTIFAFLIEKGGFEKTDGLNINENFGEFCLSILILNDHIHGSPGKESPASSDLHLKMLRFLFIQGPLLGILQTMGIRFHRFCQIEKKVMDSLDPILTTCMEDLLKKTRGVDFETFLSLIFPISTCWAGKKDFTKEPIIDVEYIEKNQSKKLGQEMRLFLEKVSLDPAEYQEKMRAVKNKVSDEFYKDIDVLQTFVKYPFVKISKDLFLLFGPHFLLRNLEFSLLDAFVLRDKKQIAVQEWFGPMGVFFEAHCQEFIKKRFPEYDSEILESPLEFNPKNEKNEEFCDALISDADIHVVFEMKYRNPPISAINPLSPSTEEIKKWVNETFLLSPEEARKRGRTTGALWQLDKASRYISEKFKKRSPFSIIPVVIIPIDLMFEVPLYSLLDEQIRAKEIFNDIPSVCPFLIISVGALEILMSSISSTPNWSVAKIFKEKSTAEGARFMNWNRFFKKIGMDLKDTSEIDKTNKFLIQKAIDRYGLKPSMEEE